MAGVPGAQTLPGQTRIAAPPDLSDRGSFEIFSASQRIGSEVFEIRSHGDDIEARGEDHLQVSENGVETEIRASSTLLLDSQLQPISYSWSQKGTKSSQLRIDFRSQPVHVRYVLVNGHEERRDFKLPPDVVVLDDNAVYQYQLALARYDQAKGGRQVLRAFIPQEAMPGEITLNFVGVDSFPGDAQKKALRHFLLTTESTQIDLWCDEHGHLQGVSSPAAQFQAVRKK